MRVRKKLKEKITTLMDSPEPDSPVFLFIPSLQAASLPKARAMAAQPRAAAPAATPPAPMDQEQKSFAELLVSFRSAKERSAKPTIGLCLWLF